MIDEKKLIEALKLSNSHHASNSREEALLVRVVRIVEEQPKIGWIPFTEDEDGILNCPLPDDEQEVLISDGKTIWNDTFINDDCGCYLAYNNLELLGLAWMPLPEPYKGVNKDVD